MNKQRHDDKVEVEKKKNWKAKKGHYEEIICAIEMQIKQKVVFIGIFSVSSPATFFHLLCPVVFARVSHSCSLMGS